MMYYIAELVITTGVNGRKDRAMDSYQINSRLPDWVRVVRMNQNGRGGLSGPLTMSLQLKLDGAREFEAKLSNSVSVPQEVLDIIEDALVGPVLDISVKCVSKEFSAPSTGGLVGTRIRTLPR